jgi:hypothetical protein
MKKNPPPFMLKPAYATIPPTGRLPGYLMVFIAIREYKLAFYYSPLADSLNREQLEQLPAQAYGPDPPKKADAVKSVPLLDY